jgi:hypothetical protein
MMAPVDDRIVTDGWPLIAEARREYEQVLASYDADGWICGRSAQPNARPRRPPWA